MSASRSPSPSPAPLELEPGCWLRHEPGWLAAPDADDLLTELRAELDWEQRAIVLFGREIMQPRLIAWAGDLPYRYSGKTLPPRPPPPALERTMARVNEAVGEAFNHVLVNRYRDGRDSMGMHSDDEPELGPDPVVASLSLGAPRRFVFASKPARRGAARGSTGGRHAIVLDHGALLVMGGRFQHDYRHGVPKTTADREDDERISLTFRRVLRAPKRHQNSR